MFNLKFSNVFCSCLVIAQYKLNILLLLFRLNLVIYEY